jgi:hypothetical protein
MNISAMGGYVDKGSVMGQKGRNSAFIAHRKNSIVPEEVAQELAQQQQRQKH